MNDKFKMPAISINESPELPLPIQRNDLGTKTNVFGAESIIKKTCVEFKVETDSYHMISRKCLFSRASPCNVIINVTLNSCYVSD
jgi:hypothetical protein